MLGLRVGPVRLPDCLPAGRLNAGADALSRQYTNWQALENPVSHLAEAEVAAKAAEDVCTSSFPVYDRVIGHSAEGRCGDCRLSEVLYHGTYAEPRRESTGAL